MKTGQTGTQTNVQTMGIIGTDAEAASAGHLPARCAHEGLSPFPVRFVHPLNRR